MKTYIVEAFTFTGKLSDVYLFLDYALNAMKEPTVQQKSLSKWMNGVPELVREERFLNKTAFSEKDLEAFALRAEEAFKESYLRKFNESTVTVLNLSLVMICTVLELFFEHILSLIFRANSRTLLTLSKDKNISVEQFIKSSTYDDVLSEFIKKTTDHVMRQGTMDILKAFDNIGMKTNEIFSWANFTEEVQVRFAGWDGKKLNSIFEERHSVVHNNTIPLRSIEELLLRKDFFTKIILNISMLAWHKFYKYGVILDSHDKIRTAIKASGGDPTTYPPPLGSEQDG